MTVSTLQLLSTVSLLIVLRNHQCQGIPFNQFAVVRDMIVKMRFFVFPNQAMGEIYGWLLIAALVSLLLILVAYGPMRPWAIFPKWSTIRRGIKHLARTYKM